MKITSLLSAVLLLSVTGLRADEKPAADPPKNPEGRPGRGPGGRQFSSEDRLKFLTEKLGLTEEQQGKIKAIFAKNEEAFKAAMSKGRENMTEEDRTKMRDLMKAQNDEITAVLTDEQKTKYKELRGPGRGERGPRPDGKEGATPPPPAPGAPPPPPPAK